VVAGVALAAVGFRFVTRSPLWLDEALSVNIARLPLGDIPEALRHDGHPPLYYFLLHGWMDVFGEGDGAVRALSGLFGLALFPLMWIAGRRLAGRQGAWAAVLVLALSPYAIRYSTETRMYSLVMLLGLAAWLVGQDALERPTTGRLVGLAFLTGALLWTHYWAMWFLAALGLTMLVRAFRARRDGRTDDLRTTLKVIGAMVAGGVLFLPWVPSLLYQSTHTGTPWAGPQQPAEVVTQSLSDLGGGKSGDSVLLGVLLLVLILLGLFGRSIDSRHVELDLGTQPDARPILVIVSLTMGIAMGISYATSSAFASRYLAILVPLIFLAVALGLTRLGTGLAFRLVAALLLCLGLLGGGRNVVTARTQAGQVGDAIRAQLGPDDLVITCPDQLGPSLLRELPAGTDVVAYPDFSRPDRIDWVDYTERLDEADPAAFANEALERAGDGAIWYVWSGSYRTHEGTCERVLNGMLQGRPNATNPVVDGGEEYFEHEALWRLPAPGT
jgi:mannosyltransferase